MLHLLCLTIYGSGMHHCAVQTCWKWGNIEETFIPPAPAQIVIRPNQTTSVDAGNTIVAVCVAYGDPNPSITWNRGDTVLSNDSRVTIYEELVTENGVMFVQSIIEVCSAEVSDAGQYSCFAENAFGNDTAVIELTVNAGGKAIVFTCV